MSDDTEYVTSEEWNKYRDLNGAIDLLKMYMDKNADKMVEDIETLGMRYIKSIMILCPIKSRQSSAIIVANAAMYDSLSL